MERFALAEDLRKLVDDVFPKMVGYRRDFHRYAESGWTEFRTASLVARRLADMGYEVLVGQDVICAQERMGLPRADTLEAHWQRAIHQGGDPEYLQAVRGGFPGVVGVLRFGDGPTVAMRFDMDALDIVESDDVDHLPAAEGFASENAGVMHACGHDAHTAVGLGVAEILTQMRGRLRGTVKFVFQPAEEGVRGAKSMVQAGIFDDVDHFFGHHMMSDWRLGEIACGLGGYAATRKFDVRFTGAASHAGASPERGRNALVAAATAVLNLYAIPRHSGGATRVNVGHLEAGTGRNVIPASALMAVETRGASTELNDYMYERAITVIQAAAVIAECQVEITPMGAAETAESDALLAERVQRVADRLGGFACTRSSRGCGSEDITYMIRRVQERGGLATVIGVGAGRCNKVGDDEVLWAHTSRFDIDERSLNQATLLLSALARDVLAQGERRSSSAKATALR